MNKSTILSFFILTSLCIVPFMVNANDEKPDASERIEKPNAPERTLYNFQDIKERSTWFPLNDDVIGGISTGTFEFTEDNTLIFSGKVALENHGGFASIRSKTDVMNLEDVKEFKLRVKGDGKAYYFNISSSNFVADPGYQARFETQKGIWEEVTLTLDDFEPAFGSNYGKENLSMEEIRLMGLIVSDKQVGPFKLEIDWIKAY